MKSCPNPALVWKPNKDSQSLVGLNSSLQARASFCPCICSLSELSALFASWAQLAHHLSFVPSANCLQVQQSIQSHSFCSLSFHWFIFGGLRTLSLQILISMMMWSVWRFQSEQKRWKGWCMDIAKSSRGWIDVAKKKERWMKRRSGKSRRSSSRQLMVSLVPVLSSGGQLYLLLCSANHFRHI